MLVMPSFDFLAKLEHQRLVKWDREMNITNSSSYESVIAGHYERLLPARFKSC